MTNLARQIGRALSGRAGLTVILSGTLAACAAPVPPTPPGPSQAELQAIERERQAAAAREAARQAELARLAAGPQTAPELVGALKAGLYRCDLKRQVTISDVQADGRAATLQWNRQNFPMKAVQANTGALRLEDQTSGLVWITIIGKSMLLDTRSGRQLANDCKQLG